MIRCLALTGSRLTLLASASSDLNERHHFVVMDVPKSLPTLADLRRAEKRMTPELMKIFNSRERLDLLDVFTWLGSSRESTPMGRLSAAHEGTDEGHSDSLTKGK